MLGNTCLHLRWSNISHAPLTGINLADFYAKLAFLGGTHIACTALYRFIDLYDVVEISIIVGDMVQSTRIVNPCVFVNEGKVSPSIIQTLPASESFLTFSTNQNFFFLFLFYYQMLVNMH